MNAAFVVVVVSGGDVDVERYDFKATSRPGIPMVDWYLELATTCIYIGIFSLSLSFVCCVVVFVLEKRNWRE